MELMERSQFLMNSHLPTPCVLTPLQPPPRISQLNVFSNSHAYSKALQKLSSKSLSSGNTYLSQQQTAFSSQPGQTTIQLQYKQINRSTSQSSVGRAYTPMLTDNSQNTERITRPEYAPNLHNELTSSTSHEANLESGSTALRQTKLAEYASTPKPDGAVDLCIATSQVSVILDVSQMASEELAQMETQLLRAEEIAASLVNTDTSSQLRPNKDRQKGPSEVYGLCLAYPAKEKQSTTLKCILIPLTASKENLNIWSRSVISKVLRASRVISFGGQKLAAWLISSLHIKDSSEWLEWCILDLQVADWLLNPDRPIESFQGLLSKHEIKQPDHSESKIIQLWNDMTLLGPAMVKIYHRLQEENLWKLFEKVEAKLVPLLAVMELTGVMVDTTKLLHYGDLLKKKISKVEALTFKAAGHKFMINSTNQLRQVLFEELHLDSMCSKELSKTQVFKKQSTSESVLTRLKEFHPLPGLVLQYRQLCKTLVTYVTGISPYITQGILRPSWQHTGAATGRLVSFNPNIQAFPKQAIDLGVVKESYIVGKDAEQVTIDIRETIVSRPGYSFIAADFRSIELRLVAHFSADSLLKSILCSQKTSDVFVHLTSEWLGVAVDSVSPVHRERTKRVVYAVVYGVGKERLAEILNVEPSYARDLTNSFLQKFPGVKKFISATIEECRNKGFLVSICGRRRWFPNILSSNSQLKSQSERQAVNFVVQGSAADICKCGMIQVSRLLSRDHPNTKLQVQIHDEMIFEVPDEEVKLVAAVLKTSLEALDLLGYSLTVPLEIRLTTGKTWSSLTELKLD